MGTPSKTQELKAALEQEKATNASLLNEINRKTDEYTVLLNQCKAKVDDLSAMSKEKDLWHDRCTELYAQEITLKNKITFLERNKETLKKDNDKLIARDKALCMQLTKIPGWIRSLFGCSLECK
jgi:chromosome segregation ATPase